MPVTAGHYNVILKGDWNGNQDIVNSFYFTVDLNGGVLVGDDDELFNVGMRMWDNIKAELRAITGASVKYRVVEVFKSDGVDLGNSGFYTIPSGEVDGLVAAQALPPNAAWTFQYSRPSAEFRHGYKRFAGVTEPDQEQGLIDAGAVARVNALAVKLRATVNLTAGVTPPFMTPALVQREKNGVPVDPDVWYTPATVLYKKIGTQNTRSWGRGS